MTQNQQLQDNQQKKNDQYQKENYYYNNYNTRAREDGRWMPAKEITPEAMQLIAEAYRENVGDKITRAAAQIIEDALNHGMEVDTVIWAIEETGLASRPSPYYLRAVLRNWAQNGVVVSRVHDEGVKITAGIPWWKER